MRWGVPLCSWASLSARFVWAFRGRFRWSLLNRGPTEPGRRWLPNSATWARLRRTVWIDLKASKRCAPSNSSPGKRRRLAPGAARCISSPRTASPAPCLLPGRFRHSRDTCKCRMLITLLMLDMLDWFLDFLYPFLKWIARTFITWVVLGRQTVPHRALGFARCFLPVLRRTWRERRNCP